MHGVAVGPPVVGEAPTVLVAPAVAVRVDVAAEVGGVVGVRVEVEVATITVGVAQPTAGGSSSVEGVTTLGDTALNPE